MMTKTANISEIVELIVHKTNCLPTEKALLVAVSGIDASGKGTIAAKLTDYLCKQGLRVALIGLDAWHHPLSVRLSESNPAEHFYQNAFRWNSLFDLLIHPLQQNRSIDLTTQLIDVAKDNVYTHTYSYEEIDVIILEGILLLKKQFRRCYDLAFWIEVSFEAALRRAIRRNQEGLSEKANITDYDRIYFPAQQLHLARDDPKSGVDGILLND